MKYIHQTPNPSGAYPPPQSNPAPSLIPISDELVADLLAYNGFVTLTIQGGAVTAVTPNLEAWEAWKQEQADMPQPTPESDPLTSTQLAVAELAETEATHDLENKLAIAELAETLMGGVTNG